MRRVFHIQSALTLLFGLLAGRLPALVFDISGAIVDLSLTSPGGELDLSSQARYLDAARQLHDPANHMPMPDRSVRISNRRDADASERRRAAYR